MVLEIANSTVNLRRDSKTINESTERSSKPGGKNTTQESTNILQTLESAMAIATNVELPPSHEYATPEELRLLSTAFTIATFMIAIDGSILCEHVLPLLMIYNLYYLATAIPRITSDFHRLEDISWYGSAYLLTEMSFQPTFGRLYVLFDAKLLYLTSIIICKIFIQLR